MKLFINTVFLLFFSLSLNTVYSQESFITTWQTTSSNESITLTTRGGDNFTDFNFIIDWGDGTIENIIGDDPDPSHVYADSGIYLIEIAGSFPHLALGDTFDAEKLLSIDQWGDIEWESMAVAFSGAENMVYNAVDLPDLSNVSTMSSMFANAINFNGSIGNWDVSNVTNMNYLFYNATSFNKDIGKWNVGNVDDMFYMFYGASNFNQDISSWDVSSVNRTNGMFGNTSSFNQNINTWDVSSVTDMRGMFFNAVTFNQDISSWNVENVEDMFFMFFGAKAFDQNLGSWNVSKVSLFGSFIDSLSTPNYDSLLIGWSKLDLVDLLIFNAGSSKHSSSSETAKRKIEILNNWEVHDGGLSSANEPFITTWAIPDSNRILTIPTIGSGYDFSIDWGDGTIESYSGINPDPTHEYTKGGEFTISITGDFPWLYLYEIYEPSTSRGNTNQLISLDQWGDIIWKNMTGTFFGAKNMINNATDIPNLSQVSSTSFMFHMAEQFNGEIGVWNVSNISNMSSMFDGATTFNQSLNYWDVSSVTDFSNMFRFAESFNSNLANWNVSSATNLGEMFLGAIAFNQDISDWNTSSVVNMSGMFGFAENFNQDLNNWDVSSVTNMQSLFQDAYSFNSTLSSWDVSNVESMASMFGALYNEMKFNQDIRNWNVSSVRNMTSMFRNNPNFNSNIEDWDISAVENLQSMFWNARSFNQNIGAWNTSNVVDFSSMFSGAISFNQNIADWNVSNADNFSAMFRDASSFNQDISSWDVSKAYALEVMFQRASSFNQDLSNWDVSKVEYMYGMFDRAVNFNQNIGNWDISKVIQFDNEDRYGFMDSVSLSSENYDSLLLGWSKLELQDSLFISFGLSKYTETGLSARQTLIEQFGWKIKDGGFFTPNLAPLISLLPDTLTVIQSQSDTLNFYSYVNDDFTPDSLLSYEFKSNPEGFSFGIDLDTGIFTYTAPNLTGEFLIKISVSDSEMLSVSDSLIIIVVSAIHSEINDQTPFNFTLSQNYPNPFNPSTNINYELPEVAEVSLKVYDLLGREVATLVDSKINAGYHTVNFDASALASGIYIYRIEAGSFSQTKRLTLIK